ncbi:MAG: YceH family protein [Acidimicrobiales bacterium]
MELSAPESRVLGCLLEKELATPQYYPLTLNALVLACNQSSNREPVVSYGEADVADAVAALREQGLARVVHSPGQRADKFRHGVEDRWALDAQHRAVLGVLLLRGPQTVGELRIRTERLARFDSLAEVEEVLGLLARREEPLVRLLDRAPGQKEARWMHLLAGDVAAAAAGAPAATAAAGAPASAGPRPGGIEELRAEMSDLRAIVEDLRASVGELRALLD